MTGDAAVANRVEPSQPGKDWLGRDLLSLMLNDDARFLFPRDDPYWEPGIRVEVGLYEPEIEVFLRQAADLPFPVIDCGANMGYWSVLASSRPYGSHQTVAVEASRDNYVVLAQNARANGNRFETLHRLVLDQSGAPVALYGRKHWGLSIDKDWHKDDADVVQEVESITIDAVAARYLAHRRHPPFVKLDIEGAEVAALRGGRRLIEEGALFVYEDHGKDATHNVSRFILALPGMAIWRIEPNGHAAPITTIEQVAAIKTEPTTGYNFFACKRTSRWASRLPA
jgi:FkbM family methyltransferase